MPRTWNNNRNNNPKSRALQYYLHNYHYMYRGLSPCLLILIQYMPEAESAGYSALVCNYADRKNVLTSSNAIILEQ